MSHPSDLSRRVSALERQNRRLRRLVGLGALCAVSLPLFAAFAPFPAAAPLDEVRARRIVLVDAHGQERSVLEVTEKNTSRFVIRDDDGTDRVLVGVDAQTAFVILHDDSGRKRIGMACDAFPHLMLHDKHQKPRIHASVGITDAPSLLFLDGPGNFALGMGLDEEGKVWRKPEDQGWEEPAAPPVRETGGAQEGEVAPPETGERKRRDS